MNSLQEVLAPLKLLVKRVKSFTAKFSQVKSNMVSYNRYAGAYKNIKNNIKSYFTNLDRSRLNSADSEKLDLALSKFRVMWTNTNREIKVKLSNLRKQIEALYPGDEPLFFSSVTDGSDPVIVKAWTRMCKMMKSNRGLSVRPNTSLYRNIKKVVLSDSDGNGPNMRTVPAVSYKKFYKKFVEVDIGIESYQFKFTDEQRSWMDRRGQCSTIALSSILADMEMKETDKGDANKLCEKIQFSPSKCIPLDESKEPGILGIVTRAYDLNLPVFVMHETFRKTFAIFNPITRSAVLAGKPIYVLKEVGVHLKNDVDHIVNVIPGVYSVEHRAWLSSFRSETVDGLYIGGHRSFFSKYNYVILHVMSVLLCVGTFFALYFHLFCDNVDRAMERLKIDSKKQGVLGTQMVAKLSSVIPSKIS